MKNFFRVVWELIYFPRVLLYWSQLTVLPVIRPKPRPGAFEAWVLNAVGSFIGIVIFALFPNPWTIAVLYLLLAVILVGENWGANWHMSWMTWTLGPIMFPATVIVFCLVFFPWLAGLIL